MVYTFYCLQKDVRNNMSTIRFGIDNDAGWHTRESCCEDSWLGRNSAPQ